MYLNNIKNNEYYIVDKINTNEKVKRRLYDIGLIKDSKIKLLYKSPSTKIKAYLIKDSIIAIRNSDAENIEVYDD